MIKVGVLGTGAYGLALALTAHRNGHKVSCYTKIEEECKIINETRMNDKVLKGVKIPKSILVTTDLKKVIDDNDFIIVAIPVPFLDNVLCDVKKCLKYRNKIFCIASKGINNQDKLMVNEILFKHLGKVKLAAISGPSFAIDIVNNSPIGLSVYGTNKKVVEITKEVFSNKRITLKETDDLIALELGGAIKNVFAIASGIIDGLGLSPSSKALFLTNIMIDFISIIEKLGGSSKSMFSYCCFGDLIMTCNSIESRNYSYGTMLAKSKEEADNYLKDHTVEGVNTLNTINELLNNLDIKIPVIKTLYSIVFDNNDPKLLIDYLIK